MVCEDDVLTLEDDLFIIKQVYVSIGGPRLCTHHAYTAPHPSLHQRKIRQAVPQPLRTHDAPVPLNIAIDGPVASGKTVVGRALARRLGLRFLDTGTMYRAVTWAAVERGLDMGDVEALSDLAEDMDIRVELQEGEQRIVVEGTDVTDLMRSQQVELNVSDVSAISGVRRALVSQQRRIAAQDPLGIVVVGRDIGTVVLPDAPVKVFLEASLHIRVRRRYDEFRRKGDIRDMERLTAEIQMRDKIDSERADSPLRPAIDAVRIETDGLRIDQVVGRIQGLIAAS